MGKTVQETPSRRESKRETIEERESKGKREHGEERVGMVCV